MILQRHVSSSCLITDPDIVADGVWRVEGKAGKFPEKKMLHCGMAALLSLGPKSIIRPLPHGPIGPGILDNFSMTEQAELETQLARLKQEHRDLDMAIDALESMIAGDQLQVQRLKKRKLVLKDQIIRLEDQLTPDIIA
jgi:hypothetical protein